MNQKKQLRADAAALALPQGRRVGQPGHEQVRQYLLGRLQQNHLVPFAGDSLELGFMSSCGGTQPEAFCNLVGVIPGANRQLSPVLVGAHYDSVIDHPCADDNATAVAVCLAIADRFASSPLERDLVVALFDSEEPPFFLSPAMGSIRFVEDHCQDLEFACVIIMDLIGHDVELGSPALEAAFPELRSLLFVLGSESDERLPGVLADAAKSVANLGVLPTLNRYVGDLSDHHAFRMAGQRYLFLSCGQGKYYHQPEDDLEWINFEKVALVAEFVSGLLMNLDRIGLSGPVRPHDSPDWEIRAIDRALGGRSDLFMAALGLPPLRSRADIDRFASVLQTQFRE